MGEYETMTNDYILEYSKFRPADKVWWLNTISGQVLPATIVNYCYSYHDDKHLEIRLASNQLMIVPESKLFFNQNEAYEKGIIQLTKKAEALRTRLNEVLTNRRNLCKTFIALLKTKNKSLHRVVM
jgi:hypothetical protein